MAPANVVFDGVWKKFRRGERHDSLRDLGVSRGDRDLWALQDVSFEVKRGEALGIIGPNGAGKSTILKLLTKILKPTRGRCAVRGRVGALIEVSAGFHPDLTGRENVFLQGAVMGMRRTEIEHQFENIVEFSGLSDFIDTPVKRYSSGMNARLGFSIAVHLEPDVLIIDEVLSVGDFAFQNRAFAKINEVVRRDIPVVVVSHQLDQIAKFCTGAILLKHGQVAATGLPAECIQRYVGVGAEQVGGPEHSVRLDSLTTDSPGPYRPGQTVIVRLSGRTMPSWNKAAEVITLRMRNQFGLDSFHTGCDRLAIDVEPNAPFDIEIAFDMNVGGGPYTLDAFVWDIRLLREIVSGPAVVMQVTDDLSQWGPVHVNPRVLRSPTKTNPSTLEPVSLSHQ
jgi:ABC-type polysaccharide/polyol phosphate transport system ATPase subunit